MRPDHVLWLLVLSAVLFVGPSSAQTVVINFDTLPTGTVVNSAFAPDVVFTNARTTGVIPASPPNAINHATLGFRWTAANPIRADFGLPMSSVSVTAIDIGSNGFEMHAFDFGNNLVDSQIIVNPSIGVGETDIVTVTAPAIAYVLMYQSQAISGDGIVLDDFTYTVGLTCQTYSPSQSTDGCGTFCDTMGTITRTRADFGCNPTDNLRIDDVNARVSFLKNDGSCSSPGTGNAFHGETSYRLDSSFGTNVILANPDTWAGGAVQGAVADIFFDQNAATVPSGTPISGTFRPNGGNLNNFNGAFSCGDVSFTLVAGDDAGLDPLCTSGFCVGVSATCIPNSPPVLSGCQPPTVNVNTNPGLCCATATFATPTATDPDPCGVPSVSRTGGVSGSCFANGDVVMFTATDAAGAIAQCSWTYAVTDAEAPRIDGSNGSTACPSDISVNAPSGACSATVNYTPPVATDNCAGVTTALASGLASGSVFPLGTTTQNFVGTDAGGLTASCSFAVDVRDVENPTVTCPSDITINNDPGLCSGVVTYNVLTADNCPNPNAVLIEGQASGSAFVVGNTNVIYNAVDTSDNNSPTCDFDVTVLDVESPTIVCPADVTLTPNSSLDCSAQFFFTYNVADNCGTSITSSHPSGFFFTGSTTVTGVVTDPSGNSASCSFIVNVIDIVSPTIDCYSAISATDPGVCSATVFFRDPDAFDVCGVDITRSGTAVSGQVYAPGTYTSTFTATDPSGNFDSCVSSIQVLDLEPPVVTGCPADIDLTNASGCDEVVTWDDSFVTRTDNCGVTSSGQSHTSGSTFPIGLTSVSYTARDAAGNVGQCSFVVRVVDDQSISFTGCPAPITTASSCSDSGTPVNWVEPTVSSDECLTYESRNFAPGSRFPDGVTTINYVAVADEAWATCLFEVTVEACPAEDGANRPPGAVGTIDLDGDGYYSDAPLIEWRDCCDSPEDLCDDPFLVNPGAFEIAANDQQDSCRGTSRSNDADGHIGGCDRNFVFANDFQLVGPTIPSEQTNEAVWALDLCEFKEDDDDPSWGFDEQQTMVFSLANGTRNGYDIGIVGPATTQAAVVDHYGGIVPARGDFMLAMSSGTARDEATGGHQSAAGATTGNTIVNLPASFLDSGASTFIEDCGGLPYAVGVDSIRGHFRMRQPTNMHAFSFQALYMDFELEAAQGSYPALGGTCDPDRKSWFLAIKTDSSTGVSGNFAGDASGRSFNSFNANPAFWSQCNDYGDFGAGLCRDGASSLELTGFTGASNWTPIGTSAEPGESFSLEFVTFDGRDGANDVTVLLDDFFPITEARTAGSSAWASQPWGYQYTADLEMVHFGATGGSPLLTKTATSVSLDFTLRNWGPEEANDVTIAFTPPLGARFTAAKDATGASLSCVTQAAAAPYADNGFVKCKWAANAPLANQATLSGSLSFALDLDCAACPQHTRQMRFRLTSTLSSIDRQLSNNYLTTDVTFV